MSLNSQDAKPWSKWHERLHKTLKAKSSLLPFGSSLLLSVSGGQDSMVLLKLIFDLKRIYEWKLHIWHGDHGWHKNSKQISEELKQWCQIQKLPFSCANTNKKTISTEEEAREWRYENLIKQAKAISQKNPSLPCKYILTGHTGSDRAETFIMNLARGAFIGGLSSLRESRSLETDIQLVRPMLNFTRNETFQICQEMNLPIWIDPSNENLQFSRNRIRHEIIPVLENLHSGSTIRIAELADRLNHLNNDQHQLTKLAIEAISHSKGISRQKVSNLSLTARSMIFNQWFKENNAPLLSANKLKELSQKTAKSKPPGCVELSKDWKVIWDKHWIEIIRP